MSTSAAASASRTATTTSRRRSPDAYAAVVKRATRSLDCTLIFEPGRLIVGNAGILVTRVLYVKRAEAKTFVIVDAGMNDLIRPTLYEAHHDIRPVREAPPGTPRIVADVVGPVCESGDFLALDRALVEPAPGDLLAVMTAGAYGAVQAGTYNTRPLVAEVMVNGDRFAVVRPRLEVDRDHCARPPARLDVIDRASVSLCGPGFRRRRKPQCREPAEKSSLQCHQNSCFRTLLCV